MLPQELGLGRGELAIRQRALLVQRSQRPEFGRNRWRRHDHADSRVAWSWRAEPVWVMAPRMIPTVMQARRVGSWFCMPKTRFDHCTEASYLPGDAPIVHAGFNNRIS